MEAELGQILARLETTSVSIRPDIRKIKGVRSNNNDLTTLLKNVSKLNALTESN